MFESFDEALSIEYEKLMNSRLISILYPNYLIFAPADNSNDLIFDWNTRNRRDTDSLIYIKKCLDNNQKLIVKDIKKIDMINIDGQDFAYIKILFYEDECLTIAVRKHKELTFTINGINLDEVLTIGQTMGSFTNIHNISVYNTPTTTCSTSTFFGG